MDKIPLLSHSDVSILFFYFTLIFFSSIIFTHSFLVTHKVYSSTCHTALNPTISQEPAALDLHPVISPFSCNERLDPSLFCAWFHLLIVCDCNFLDLQNYLFESTNMQFMAQFKWVLNCLSPLTSSHIFFFFQNGHWNRQNLKNLATNKNYFERN